MTHHHNNRTTLFPIILILPLILSTCSAFHHVLTGTGALEVQLIAAKLAIRAGDTVTLVGPSDTSHIRTCRALLYGGKAAKAQMESDPNTPTSVPLAFVTDGGDIANSLERADYVHLVCDDKAFGDSMVGSIIESAPSVKHVVLLSKMGGGLKGLEDVVKGVCEKRGVPCSVARVGVLKGGGPGGQEDEGTDDTEGETAAPAEDIGLARYFYDTNFDLPNAMNTMAFDKYTLGAKITPGDPYKTPGKLWQSFTKSNTFEPADTDTGRIAAAQAMLRCAVREKGVDVSVSTSKGKVPPSDGEWEEMLVGGEY